MINALTSNNEKSYRFKKRYSFSPNDDSPFRVDMTIVKSSTGKNIKSSNVFQESEEFQCEIELLPKQAYLITPALENMFKMIAFLKKYKIIEDSY